MTNEFKILLIIVIFLLAISIGLNAFSGRYTLQVESGQLLYKLDTWTGKVFVFIVDAKNLKKVWIQLPDKFKLFTESTEELKN